MNPNNNTTPPTTPSNDSPTNNSPAPSAGDEAALQAIEALETESNEVGTTPTTIEPVVSPSPSVPVTPAPATFSPTPSPVITEPLVPTTPVVTPPSTDVSSSSTPSTPDSTTPASTSPIADSLKDDTPAAGTASSTFQPFAKPKTSKKKLIILVIVLVVLVLGAGGYFGWQYLQAQNTPAPAQTITPPAQPESTDTEESVNASATDMESQLAGVDDTEYADTTLSDSTLYN